MAGAIASVTGADVGAIACSGFAALVADLVRQLPVSPTSAAPQFFLPGAAATPGQVSGAAPMMPLPSAVPQYPGGYFDVASGSGLSSHHPHLCYEPLRASTMAANQPKGTPLRQQQPQRTPGHLRRADPNQHRVSVNEALEFVSAMLEIPITHLSEDDLMLLQMAGQAPDDIPDLMSLLGSAAPPGVAAEVEGISEARHVPGTSRSRRSGGSQAAPALRQAPGYFGCQTGAGLPTMASAAGSTMEGMQTGPPEALPFDPMVSSAQRYFGVFWFALALSDGVTGEISCLGRRALSSCIATFDISTILSCENIMTNAFLLLPTGAAGR